jgi:hypothetical protein
MNHRVHRGAGRTDGRSRRWYFNSLLRPRVALLVLVASALAQTAATPSAEKKYTISGTVVDSLNGGVLPDIEVSIRTAESDTPLRAVETGDDGRFEFRDVPRGKYGLNARGHGYLMQAFQEHGAYSTAIVTGEGLQSEGLVFPLKPEASLSGTVTDEFNEPVAHAQVMLFVTGMPGSPETVFHRGTVTSDDMGHYRFGRLGEGKYYVVVSGQPWYARSQSVEQARTFVTRAGGNVEVDIADSQTQVTATPSSEAALPPPEFNVAFQTTYYPNVTSPDQATAMVVKPGDRAVADFHMFAVPAARLRYRGAPTNPRNESGFPSLRERIFSLSRNVFTARSDDNGIAEFTGLAPGRYVLQLPKEGNGPAQELPVDVAGDMEIAPSKTMEPVSTVTGIVQFDDGTLPGAQGYIRLNSLRSGEGFGGVVSAKGEFRIESGVRPAAYNVALFNMNDSVVKSISAVGAKVTGHQVEIPRGGSVRMVIVLTKGLGRIDGIALHGGKPASQTAIFLVPEDPGHNLSLVRRDQSDSDGTFTLRQVVPGNYTLVSIAEGWELEWTDPAVLKPYLKNGVKVRVEANRKYQLKVDVQQREASATAQAR